MNKADPITIRLDSDLRAVLDEMQRYEGRTRTDMIHVLLQRGIDASPSREQAAWASALSSGWVSPEAQPDQSDGHHERHRRQQPRHPAVEQRPEDPADHEGDHHAVQ